MNSRTLFVCALLAVGSLGSVVARAELVALAPSHAGHIFDQDPFDGFGDAIDEGNGVAVVLNAPLLDLRGITQFDLSALSRRPILSASLEVTPLGQGIGPGITRIPIQLYAYPAKSTIQLKDFNQGIFVDVFDAFNHLYVPISIDVTKEVRAARTLRQRYLGFSLRTSMNGGSITFGSPAIGSPPRLVINYQ